MININSTKDKSIQIIEYLSFNDNCLKNRIWYRGESTEIEQFFKQISTEGVSKARFWASVPSGSTIRKFHTGIYATIIDTLTDLILGDFQGIETIEPERWKEIADDNNWDSELFRDAITDTLIVGDGVFKISYDSEISKYPIIEFVSGENLDIISKRGRIVEYQFTNFYEKNKKKYKLIESYKLNSIEYKLYDDNDIEVSLSLLGETQNLSNVYWKGDYILCVPIRFYKSPKHKNRGMPLLDRKSDNIDALDEVVSQWIEAIRDGRVKTYIPESLLPKDPTTGKVMPVNPFDNKFIATETSLKEGVSETISQVQANINYEAFLSSYVAMLDLVLQGIVSPSTLGIDMKKTDNAEAQREKEKTTTKTRVKIVDTLTAVIPKLIDIVLKCQDTINKKPIKDYESSIVFGEYAAASFEERVNTISTASAATIISIERFVDELWGDVLTDEEKAEEVERIKALRGIEVVEEDVKNISDLDEENKEEEDNKAQDPEVVEDEVKEKQ